MVLITRNTTRVKNAQVKRIGKPRHSKLKDWLIVIGFSILLALVAWILTGAAENPQAILITETYTVCKGDTLDTIADKFIAKNTYGTRYHDEFKEGIIEINWDRVFADRPGRNIYPGDKLVVNYLIKK